MTYHLIIQQMYRFSSTHGLFVCHESNTTKYCNMTLQINMTTFFVFACLMCNLLGNNSFEGLGALVVTCNIHSKYCLT